MPLLWVSLSFLLGLVLGQNFSWGGWLPLGVVLALAWLLARRTLVRRMPRAWVSVIPLGWLRWLAAREPHLRVPPLFLGCVLALGAWWYGQSTQIPADSPAALLNERGAFRMVGVVDEPPSVREQSTLVRVRLETASALDEEGQPGSPVTVNGLVLALLPGRAAWQYGDRLVLDGRPETPPGASENSDFSYSDYLARQGIYSYLKNPEVWFVEQGAGSPLLAAIYRLRQRAYAVLYRIFPAPEAPLLAGILLGLDNDLPDDLSRAFQNTGTAHIIAISGFNIAILAALFSAMFTGALSGLLSRWWILALTVLAVAGYTVLAGAGASVVRAAVMGSLALLAAQLGRRSGGAAGFNTLAFTAAVMCLINPHLPWDASFQLSFAATLGLMIYATPLQESFVRLAALRLPLSWTRRLAGPVGEYVLMTLAAQVTTLPVILYHFRRLSVSALLVNPLVLPAQPLVMILSGLAVVAGMALLPLGQVLAWLSLPLTTYTIGVIEAFSTLSWGVLALPELSPPVAFMLFAAVSLPALRPALLVEKVPGWLKAWFRPGVILVGLGLLAAFVLRAALTAPDGRLHLTVMEQGGQNAVLVQAPDGSRLLVNAGSSANRLSAALGSRFSPFDRRIDGLLVADCRDESLESMLALVDRFTIHSVWWACDPPASRSTRSLLQEFEAAGIESRALVSGSRMLLGQTLEIQVLDSGEQFATLKMEWRNLRVLVPGGLAAVQADAPGLLVLGPQDFQGARDWQAIDPQVVVVSPPQEPGFDLPGYWVRLNPWGWVEVVTDGEEMWLELGE